MHVHSARLPGDNPEPARTPLTLGCHRLDGGVLITVIGEVDTTNAGQLESYIRRRMLPGMPVVIDCRLLTFMESSGLRALTNLHTALTEQGSTLHLAGVHGIPARLLRVTGMWPLLNIHAGTADAMLGLLSPGRPTRTGDDVPQAC
ncbi:STAS domain-containing protein [Nonomuraea sp. NPDC050404]|uniref:STAS domain-containing protein n=1 Tax=Nonomuraea sp. NPDC050404 TaxID=3155783 RepID=UPI0033D6D33C